MASVFVDFAAQGQCFVKVALVASIWAFCGPGCSIWLARSGLDWLDLAALGALARSIWLSWSLMGALAGSIWLLWAPLGVVFAAQGQYFR